MAKKQRADFEERLKLPPFSGQCLAAVSGGADSTAMLAALAARRDAGAGFELCCMHVDHGLRGAEAEEDARFVRALCRRLRTPFVLARIRPGELLERAAASGEGIEAAARRARYELLRREADARGARLIATAHTGDDVLETVLMRILRGAGPAGLSPFCRPRGILCRPLLSLSRADILRYLAERGLPFRVDSTNRDLAFTRNRLRLCLIPALDEHFPGWKSALRELSATQYYAADFLAACARAALGPPRAGALSIPRFDSLDAIVKEEALFCAMDSLSRQPEAPAALEADPPDAKTRIPRRRALRRWIASGARAASLGAFRLTREPDGSVLVHPKVAPREERALVLKSAGRVVIFMGTR